MAEVFDSGLRFEARTRWVEVPQTPAELYAGPGFDAMRDPANPTTTPMGMWNKVPIMEYVMVVPGFGDEPLSEETNGQ